MNHPARRAHLAPGIPTQAESWVRRVGALTAVPDLIRQFGVDPAPVLSAAGVQPGVLDNPSNDIPYVNLLRLLNGAAARTGCAHFGLLAGRVWHLADLGVVGDLMRHSPTVDRALQELILYHHLRSHGAVAFLLRENGSVDLGYAIYVPVAENRSQLYDGVLAATMNFLRAICGDDWTASEVRLPHSPPDDIAPYRQCFQAPLHFDSEYCSVRFSASWLQRRIEGADPEKLRAARVQADSAGKAVLVEAVQRTSRTLLLHGRSAGADVAQSLAMHRRTLTRRLRAEQTTFQRILDSVRFAVAVELLQQSTISMPDIASALGYASVGPFMRAFRRWTGTTPGAWRDSARP